MPKQSLPLAACLLVFSFAACTAPTPIAEVTPTASATWTPVPSATPSPASTVMRTPTQTRTPTETLIPPPTNTPLPLPTFTPATPLTDGSRYQLMAWNAEKASELIDIVKQNAVLNTASYFGFPDYHLAHSVAIAQSEGLRRYADAPAAAAWRWSRAYHLALNGSPLAGKAYATLLVDGLNSGEVTIDNLSYWVESHQEKWSLKVNALNTPENHQAGYLIQLQPEFDELGGACIFIMRGPEGYLPYVAESGFSYSDVQRGLRRWLSCGSVDLTGDGVEEVIAGSYFGGRLGDSIDSVYSVKSFPPVRLLFGPAGPNFIGGWLVEPRVEEKEAGVEFYITRFLFPCHVELLDRADLRWNGAWFEQGPFVFTVGGAFDTDTCWGVIDNISKDAGPHSNTNLWQAVLKSRPALEQRDGIRYRLGIYQALAGNSSDSISTFNDLITSPAVITSTWVTSAQKFLDAFKTPDDLYRACASAPLCEPRFAIEQLTHALPRAAFPLALDELRQRSVPIRASGLFDFEGDGESEHWFTVRHPSQSKTELWLVARTPEGIKALRVSEVGGTPSFARLTTGDEARAAVQVTAGGSESFFAFVRAPNTREPFVAVIEATSTPPVTATSLIPTAMDDLFDGVDPATVRAVLLKARESRDFDCEAVDCPQFEYLLGLTYELTGDEPNAVQTYLNLWRTYPDSPFTLMARAKLELAP